MANGWFRRKKDKLWYCWYSASGTEHAKVLGPDTLSDAEGWLKVGELGLDKLAGKPDPARITFDDVLSHYLAYGRRRRARTRPIQARSQISATHVFI